ncbi:MAG: beta-lactamase family protein [Acidimicrobiia bacterium]|nr:beta-lactamase family protein [Acidimicrobiia bacterium]
MRWIRRLGWVVGALVLLIVIWAVAGAIVYSPEYVFRVLRSRESSVQDYLVNFPLRTLTAAAEPFTFPEALDEEMVRSVFEGALEVDDLDQFLEETDTQALIVIQDGTVLYEGYYNGTQRDSMLTSFSVAKSFDSALIGIAIGEGFISSVEDPITVYLPELAERDPGFEAITIRDLLRMAAGLDYQELRWFLFNGDDPLTTYYPDQREITLENTNIVDPPGLYFNYNKYHPQMLGMILERATGMSVTEYTQTRLWDPLGMEFDGAWALDSVESGFEKMEAGLNARAIDFAKFGQLFLQGGAWEGEQVVPEAWVEESTSLDVSTQNAAYYSHSFGPYVYDDGAGYYKYMWYGKLRAGQPADILAEGDHGQIIFTSPANGVVIVRNGSEYGVELATWTDAMFTVAGQLYP